MDDDSGSCVKNYSIKEVPADVKQQLEEHFRDHDRKDHDNCHLCGRQWYGEHTCGPCRKACSHACVWPGFIIKHNGTRQAYRRCHECGYMTGPKLGPVKRGTPIFNICLRDLRSTEPCEHCGEVDGVELHHWAPRNTFSDADAWPTAWLCRLCHHHWHNKMDGYQWHRKALEAM